MSSNQQFPALHRQGQVDAAAIQANIRTEAAKFKQQISSIEEELQRQTPAGPEAADFEKWKARNHEFYTQDVELLRERINVLKDSQDKVKQETAQMEERTGMSLSSQMKIVKSSVDCSMSLEEQQIYDAIMETLKHSPAMTRELYSDQSAYTSEIKMIQDEVHSFDVELKRTIQETASRSTVIYQRGRVKLELLEERIAEIQRQVESQLDELTSSLQSRHIATQQDITGLFRCGEDINVLIEKQEGVLSEQTSRMSELQEKASGLETALTNEKDAHNGVEASLREQIQKARNEIVSLQSEKQAMTKAQETAEGVRATLQTDLDTSRSANAAKDDRIRNVESQLQTDLETSRSAIEAKDDCIRDLESQLQNARAEKGRLTSQITAKTTELGEARLEANTSKAAAEQQVSRSKAQNDADERRGLWLIKKLADTMENREYDVKPTRSPVSELEGIQTKLSTLQGVVGRPSPQALPPIMFYNHPPPTAEVQETDGESLWIMALTGRIHLSGVQYLLDETLGLETRLRLLPWIEAATRHVIGSIHAIEPGTIRFFQITLGLVVLRCIAYIQSSLSISPANAAVFDLPVMLDELESAAAWQELVLSSLFVKVAYDSVRDMLSVTPTAERWASRMMRAIDETERENPGSSAIVPLTSQNSYLPDGVCMIMDLPHQHQWALVIHAGTPEARIFVMGRHPLPDPELIHHETVALYKLRTFIRLDHVRGLPAKFHRMDLMMADRPDVAPWLNRFSAEEPQ